MPRRRTPTPWDDARVIEWILTSCAVLALAGAGSSWWWAASARAARDEALAVAGQTRQALADLARPAAASTAPALPEPPADPVPLALEPGTGVTWRLRNISPGALVIENLANPGDFVRRPFDALPAALAAGDTTEVTLVGAWGHPLPAAMDLRLAGVDRIVRVPLPSGIG